MPASRTVSFSVLARWVPRRGRPVAKSSLSVMTPRLPKHSRSVVAQGVGPAPFVDQRKLALEFVGFSSQIAEPGFVSPRRAVQWRSVYGATFEARRCLAGVIGTDGLRPGRNSHSKKPRPSAFHFCFCIRSCFAGPRLDAANGPEKTAARRTWMYAVCGAAGSGFRKFPARLRTRSAAEGARQGFVSLVTFFAQTKKVTPAAARKPSVPMTHPHPAP